MAAARAGAVRRPHRPEERASEGAHDGAGAIRISLALAHRSPASRRRRPRPERPLR